MFLSAAVLLATLALPAASALAVVTPVEGHPYGVTSRNTELFIAEAPLLGTTEPSAFANAAGHSVVHTSNVYAIYWDPTDSYGGDWQHIIDGFLRDVGVDSGSTDNVFAVDTQYLDKTNARGGYHTIFRGAYTDTDAYPASICTDPSPLKGSEEIGCVTDSQAQLELRHFIAQHSLQAGMNAIFYLLTPPGVTVCLDNGGAAGHCSDYKASSSESYENSFCSYHADVNPNNAVDGDGSTILYAVIPWTAGGLGDYRIPDAESGVPCQDGGFDPSSKPIEEPEENPAPEEPNEIVGHTGPDGMHDTGLADLIINQIAVEQQNTVTDPLLNAWQDPTGHEEMDECRNFFAPVLGGGSAESEETSAGSLYNQTINGDNYYLNNAFNLAAEKLIYPGVPCIHGLNFVAQFTAPSQVNANELVSFNGMESDITLDAGVDFTPADVAQPTYATYTWNFGDGTPEVSGYAPGGPEGNSPAAGPCEAPWLAPCAASTFHSYQYGGIYHVTLTVTDVGGNTESVTEPMEVLGSPRPATGGGGGGDSAGAGSPSSATPSTPSSSGGSKSPSGGVTQQGQTPVGAPVLSAVILSKSLKKSLRSGLTVRYTVNEQVAGSVQVLLDAATAKLFHIRGPLATGLAAGARPMIVLASQVLVTTRAGTGTIRIKFASRTVRRLAHARKLKLTLRVIAHNASRVGPRTSTVTSTIALSR